ncbi:hypothetical protein VKT23_016568 [Stygiomarasmius scandens]|uniref:Uncharacterized protein n=1 Tax=Marasmiellus scandens TaxID=2682957 RepID=A0ABR1IUT2_9AGAR
MSGCATISAIAVLENARSDGGQSILFDAHFFYYDDPASQSACLALLRYFNADNETFDPEEPKTYFVHVNIARMETFCDVSRLSDGMELKDYVLVGDILIPADGVDPRHRPYLSVCGIVASYDRAAEDKKIEVSPYVFTHVLCPKLPKPEDDKGKAKPSANPSPIFPVAYVVPKTARWAGERAPKVSVGTYVCVEGFLHMVHRRPSNNMVDRFDAELDKVTFLGRPYIPATSRKSLAPPSTPSPSTPANKRLKFSYADTTPTPASKRKATDLD